MSRGKGNPQMLWYGLPGRWWAMPHPAAPSPPSDGVLMTSSPPTPLTACPSVADGVTAFHTFLKTEFSEENLDFWLACEDFKKTRSKTKLASKANRIFEEFVQSEAPREVRADPASAVWHWMGRGRDKTS